MKKLLLALAISASISTGASAVTCGENQQPDYTNSYCVDVEATTTYSSMYEFYKGLNNDEKEEFLKAGCDQMYQAFITQLIAVRSHTTLICDTVCKVKKSSFLPLGEFSNSEDISMKLFNDQLRWIATAVMKKDPELTSGDSIYFDFLKTCRANEFMVVRLYQRAVDLKFGGDVNKAIKYMNSFE